MSKLILATVWFKTDVDEYVELPGRICVPETIVQCDEISNAARTVHLDRVSWNCDSEIFELWTSSDNETYPDVKWFCFEGILSEVELQGMKDGKVRIPVQVTKKEKRSCFLTKVREE